ncbi:MAG: hypothetical protein EP329_07095 [Deltaproteobacteria bacterium]|nr:MAG: hypothetical protein EP329_07095 [Deltaproteobacteria bacterium]
MSAAHAVSRRPVARWRYVVPNAITLVSLMLGLSAVVLAFAGDFDEAAWLVVLCVLLDKLDGSAARLLGATSRIGVQLDSFSDFVTFGIAPGALIFARLTGHPAWAGEALHILLVALVSTYVLSAVIRLAKFNVLNDILPADGPKVFYGLPTTFAGGLFVIVFIIGEKYQLEPVIQWLPVLGVALAALMVSNWPLPKLVLRKSKALNALQLVNVVLGYACGVGRFWPEYLLGGVLVYAVVGFSWGLTHKKELTARRLDPYPT